MHSVDREMAVVGFIDTNVLRVCVHVVGFIDTNVLRVCVHVVGFIDTNVLRVCVHVGVHRYFKFTLL